MIIIDIESFAADHGPEGGRGGAALASAIDWECGGVGVGFLGDAQLGFNLVDRDLKHVTVDLGDVAI